MRGQTGAANAASTILALGTNESRHLMNDMDIPLADGPLAGAPVTLLTRGRRGASVRWPGCTPGTAAPPVRSRDGPRVSPDAPRKGATLAYLPALDGIRGVAMIGILGVHGGVYLTAGGFFFLDSFFALSGFLITSLLLVEWRKRGTIKLGAFWARRARRLLPALFVMLIGVAVLFGIFVPAGTYPTLRGDSLSALFYVANWHYIASGSDYFHMTGLTSPLIHTWSLAVEEQFYLVWPLVFLAVLKIWGSLRVLLIVAVTGAIASALEMALLYNPTNINRLYFGTDTHAQSVLVGATLAVGLRMWAERSRKGDEGIGKPARPGRGWSDRSRLRRPRRSAPSCSSRCRPLMPSPITVVSSWPPSARPRSSSACPARSSRRWRGCSPSPPSPSSVGSPTACTSGTSLSSPSSTSSAPA